MAKKRFTDIEIWDKEWYMDLKPVHKCLMKYIFDKCDAAGCWKPNWKLASLHIGESVNFSDLSSLPKDQYEVLESGKIFIKDFINFQYGTLSEKSPAHNPVFLAISKNGLSNRVFNRVSNTLQEKDKDKEEEKEMEIIHPEIKKTLCPEMLKIFMFHVKQYMGDKELDFPSLLAIANFLHRQGKLEGSVTANMPQILDVWEIVCQWIAKDNFYCQKSLKTISNHIQEIINKTQNGTPQQLNGKTPVINGKNTGAYQLLAKLKLSSTGT